MVYQTICGKKLNRFLGKLKISQRDNELFPISLCFAMMKTFWLLSHKRGDGHQSTCTFSFGSHYNHAMVPTIIHFYSISMIINHSVVGVYLPTLVGDI